MTTMNVDKIKGILEKSDDFVFIVAGDVLSFDKMMATASEYTPYVESQTFDAKYELFFVVSLYRLFICSIFSSLSFVLISSWNFC